MDRWTRIKLIAFFSVILGTAHTSIMAQNLGSQSNNQDGLTQASSCGPTCSSPHLSRQLNQIMASIPAAIQMGLEELEEELRSDDSGAADQKNGLEHSQDQDAKNEVAYNDADSNLRDQEAAGELSAEEQDRLRESINRMRDHIRTLRNLELYQGDDWGVVLRNFERIEYHKRLKGRSQLTGTLDKDKFFMEYKYDLRW